MKFALGGLWLVLALLLRERRVFAYAGSVVAMVHLCALVCGRLYQAIQQPSATPGVSTAGFLAGIAMGVIAGTLIGGPASRNPLTYWAMQATAAGFLMFLPLFRI